MARRWWVAFAMTSLWTACGGEGGGGPDASGPPCQHHDDCDDRRFCNGAERCDPSAPSADARGCASGTPPCPAERCDELGRQCEACADADGDGYFDIRCGGDDCDDANPAIHPGATEVCDPEHVDEDCDPTTFAGPEGDRDRDGYISNECCNVQPNGALRCGDDCDDDDPRINPGATERCDGVDNDCNGSIDEGCPCSPAGAEERCDDELDGVGVCRAGTRLCTMDGWTACVGSVRPGPELCNTLEQDENCNGVVDEGCDCLSPLTRRCSTDIGRCVERVQTCSLAGRWPRECADEPGVVFPQEETCNGLDDDCDGVVDNGCGCVHGAALECGDEIGACTRGTQVCTSGVWSSCNAVGPSPEVCNRIDDNCNGAIDEGAAHPTCSFERAGAVARTAFQTCLGGCPAAPSADVIFRLGTTVDTTPRAVWLESGGAPADWGSGIFEAEASFRVVRTSSNPQPVVRAAVAIAPVPGIGHDARRYLPMVPTGRVGFAAEAETSEGGGRIRLIRFGTSAQVVAESSFYNNPSCTPARGQSVRHTIQVRGRYGDRIRAMLQVHGRPGCDNTQLVFHTEADWVDTLYGSSTDVRTFDVGVVVHGTDTNGTYDLEEVRVRRATTDPVAERGFCRPCPWRI